MKKNQKLRRIESTVDMGFREHFKDAASIFRMICPSGLGINPVLYRIYGMTELNQHPSADFLTPTHSPMGEVICRIEERYVPLINRLWNRLKRSEDNPERYSRTIRALETYKTALCSTRKDDITRDMFVVFETLFRDGGRELDRSISMLVSDSAEQLQQNESFIRSAKKIRNDSTHGSRMQTAIDDGTFLNTARIAGELLCYSFAAMGMNNGI